MATRNLTKKFIDLRNATKGSRKSYDQYDHDGGKGLLESGDAVNFKAMKQTLPPAWVDKIELVEEDISKIQLKIDELSTLHKKRLKVDFETDETQQEREIDQKTMEITEIFHHAENVLKKFSRQSEDPKLSVSERTVRKNMQMSIAKKLQTLSVNFRTAQKQYMNQLQNQKTGGAVKQLDFLNEPQKAASSTEFIDTGFDQQNLAIMEDMETLVNQRDEEINRIAKSIEELAAIFKELAVLVIDQGTILDRIDYNMESAVGHAQEGMKQLEKAEEHQKNAMATKCIIVLVILIIIMLSVLIWKHQKK